MSPRRPLAAPDRERLASLPLDVLVRDYPEALGVLRGHGIDPARDGLEPLDSQAGAAPALAALLEATRWRTG